MLEEGPARLGLAAAAGMEGIAPSSTLCLSFAKVHLPVLPVPMPNPRRAHGFAPTLGLGGCCRNEVLAG